ncbi:MAG: polysaccharide biosynthesis/export family protein [Verrucomicrobia bacterium]|nr:polysaccharide biosynthesis/export family protein [Verrucomicrobiota bacterium]
MAWLRLVVLAATATVLLSGCPIPGNSIKYEEGLPPLPEGDPALNYRIVVGDVLSIEGGKNAELAKDSVQVDENGEINLIYMGKIKVVDLTKSELEAAINKAYMESGKYQDAQITVSVLTLYYFVDGEVRIPGRKQYLRQMTLYRAIVDAGGFTEFAAPTRVTLLRPQPDGTHKVWKINISQVMRGSKPDNVVILPNDVIRVPKSVF